MLSLVSFCLFLLTNLANSTISCSISGDLNYRISLTRSIVSANIRSNNLKLLLEHDQLAKEMKTNQSFRLRSFREAEINFAPTYKFDPWVTVSNPEKSNALIWPRWSSGTDNYDSSAKERIPAWCDRILYRVNEPLLKQDKIKALDYRSWSATPSDHKPISGLYVVRVKKMHPERHQKIRDEMEVAWKARAKDILVDARRFHGVLWRGHYICCNVIFLLQICRKACIAYVVTQILIGALAPSEHGLDEIL